MESDIIPAMKSKWPRYQLMFIIATVPELTLMVLDASARELQTEVIKFRSKDDEAAKKKAAELCDEWTSGNDYQDELIIPSMLIRGFRKETIIEEYSFVRHPRIDRTLNDVLSHGVRERLN